jgi:hypothetical protein
MPPGGEFLCWCVPKDDSTNWLKKHIFLIALSFGIFTEDQRGQRQNLLKKKQNTKTKPKPPISFTPMPLIH